MAAPFVPDLDALETQSDPQVAFYAMIGVLISLCGGLERSLFEIFEKGTQLDHDLAAQVFHAVRSDEARSEMAQVAMTHRLRGDAALAAEWKALATEIFSAATTRERNLVGHNPVVRDIHMVIPTGKKPSGLLLLWDAEPVVSPAVRQDPIKQAVKPRKGLTEVRISEVKAACKHLSALLTRLDALLARIS